MGITYIWQSVLPLNVVLALKSAQVVHIQITRLLSLSLTTF